MLAFNRYILIALAAVVSFSAAVAEEGLPSISDTIEKSCQNLECSRLVEVWKEGIEDQEAFHSNAEFLKPPGTIVTPSDFNLINYTPQDAPSPFFSDDPKDRNLTARILKDFFIKEKVDLKDEKLSRTGGYTLMNLNGNNITITKSDLGELSVNDIPVVHAREFDQGFTLFVINGALFDHMRAMHSAMLRLSKERRHINPFARPPNVMQQ